MTAVPAARAPAPGAIALMYHALTGPGSPDAGQDPHYSIAPPALEAHLALFASRGAVAVSARDWLGGAEGTVVTFDDGHLSNYTLAFPRLVAQSARADFFVNPARVGSHGFADWPQLREMAAAGQSIQSHGWDHRYFTELPPAALREDLTRSRKAIEDAIGQPVTLLAPPGGRSPPGLAAFARSCGYSHVLGSQPGRLHDRAAPLLPRMAVTASLDAATLEGWLQGRGIARARLRYALLGLAKRVLGTRGYEHLRRRLLDQEDPA